MPMIFMENNFKILSAIFAYAKQLGAVYSFNISDFIQQNESLAKELVKNFEQRFNPSLANNERSILSVASSAEVVEEKFKNFILIADDLITKAIVRTNYFLNKNFVSFKVDLSLFNSSLLNIPKPLTFKEIFVFSDEFEAIHLRGGKIARGGIRWSDRKDDYRTEVLGLVKTQNTKNTIIVPVGSKGGFIIKKPIDGLTKNEVMELGKLYYRSFLCGLLDITDNVIDGNIVHPQNVVSYDGEDPYLVVAADKGTATFSDIANEIAKEYNFWMGDAFASGGSNGYDHKKMAITAKGAWVCVQRHFREIGIDVQKQEFTVVAVGDMSGDVFGNSMLRSDKTKLICAFNHMNIFIDPNPDSSISFEERKRMFALPSSTWQDYNLEKASKGSAIFKRSDAICNLTPEIKERFGIEDDALSPADLIKVVLKSKYDLFLNGGIGTYVKSESESHQDAKDAVNDSLRINGNELGAKVVCEGGNLGFTAKGRIEYALNGGRINTDAIDNSAGVDCSDHEVNIKILLNPLVSSGKITLEERNKLIRVMEECVERLVLRDNYLQSLALSVEELNGKDVAQLYSGFIKDLEASVGLDRVVEKLPLEEELKKRYAGGQKLTRPELSILLAYAKIESFRALLESEVIKDKFLERLLVEYFPLEMQKNYLEEIKNHKLRDEIFATIISNKFINSTGIIFGFDTEKRSKKSLIQVIKAYLIAESILNLEEVLKSIESMDYKVKAKTQYEAIFALRRNIIMPLVLEILQHEKEFSSISDGVSYFKNQLKKITLNRSTLEFVGF